MTVVADKPTIPEVVPLIREYYARPGNGLGGLFHVILEDGNVAPWFASSATNQAGEVGDALAVRIGTMLQRMTRSQRHRLYRRLDFYP